MAAPRPDIPLTAGGRQHVAEQPPRRAVKLLQLHLFDRIEIVGRGGERNARQQHRQLHIVQTGGLLHHVLAGEIVAAGFEHRDHRLRVASSR